MHFKRQVVCFLTFGWAVSVGICGMEVRQVRYELDGAFFESTIVFDGESVGIRPGVLMVPNWMGPTDESLEKAWRVAGDDFVVMMVDMYGVEVRPANSAEAGKAARLFTGDRELMRARAGKALSVFRSEADGVGLDPGRIAAIGFCFGGGTVLEFGRSGADLDAIVSFHGDLNSPTLETDASSTRARVLVLHGAADPYVPQSEVQTFVDVMLGTDVDWQLVQFSNTVHSFTNPKAAKVDAAQYNRKSSDRAFEMMEALFEEIWDGDNDH